MGSDTTQMATCNNSVEESSVHSLGHHHRHYHYHRHRSTPIICYCQLPPTYCQEKQAYRLYHEIPSSKAPVII